MRYVFGFSCICALGMMPWFGCSEEAPECMTPPDVREALDENCDDQNECTADICTYTWCSNNPWPVEGESCDRDGVPGVCISGVCGEDVCQGVVCRDDDRDPCLHWRCDYRTGMCEQYHPCEYRDSCSYQCDETDGSCIYNVRSGGCCYPNFYTFNPGGCLGGYCAGGSCHINWGSP
jgi:hypothetical protein